MSGEGLLAALDFAFMRQAVAGGLILALAGAPLGVFLMLRRMSLMGDAMAHGVLPGVAAGFLLAGLSLPAMALGGLVAGLFVALAAGAIARATNGREDASLAALYLAALAGGVVLLSLGGPQVDLAHILFGSALGADREALFLMAGAASLIFLALAVIWPALVLETADPAFLRGVSHLGGPAHAVFLGLVVIYLVAAFQVFGTLMAVGVMILPAAAARFWTVRLFPMIAIAAGIGAGSAVIGLLASYQLDSPSGPAIVLTAAGFYALSLVFGPAEGLAAQLRPRRHLAG